MDIVIYTQYYRSRDAGRQRELDECLRRNLNHPRISKVMLFLEDDAPPLPKATVALEIIPSRDRLTYAEWFRWVRQQQHGIALLLNSDIYLDEGLEHLTSCLDSPDVFVALTRYNPVKADFHLNDYPHWTQDVWGVRADALLPDSLLYASGFPLGYPGCDNRIAFVLWSHGFHVRNPCYHLRSIHLQAAIDRAYDKNKDRLYGGVSYVHPSLAPDEDAELEFTLWTRSPDRPAGVLINQQSIEQGVHQLSHTEVQVAQRFLDQQQFSGLSWIYDTLGSAHLQGDLHPFASEDTVFLPMPALLGKGIELKFSPTRLEGLTLRLPRRANAGHRLQLQAKGEGEAQPMLQGEAALELKAGGERRFWHPKKLKGTSWQQLHLKLIGPTADTNWLANEGAELVLFSEEGSLEYAKSLCVIAEDSVQQAQWQSGPLPALSDQLAARAYQYFGRSECEEQLAAARELHVFGRRFRILRSGGELLFEDRFWPSVGVSPIDAVPCGLDDTYRLFLWGFGQPVLELRPDFIANTRRFSDDVNFWQYPCRTEGDAFAVHKSFLGPQVKDGVLQVYLGLPWATWIDSKAWPTSTLKATSDRLCKLREQLQHLGIGLKVHSVCQHIFWREYLHLIKASGVDCLWLSHKPKGEDQLEGVDLKPWHLYAVNAREAERRQSLWIRPITSRPWLATFVGAHMDHYITDVRSKLLMFKDLHRFHIAINDEWHFTPFVYRENSEESPVLDRIPRQIEEKCVRYNRILSDTQFSLCPGGAGPNSLRLWESMAVGCIPVILSDQLVLPDLAELSSGRWSNWDQIVLFHPEADLESLPERLQSFSVEDIQQRSAAAIDLMRQVNQVTCLGVISDRFVEPVEIEKELEFNKPQIVIPVYGPTDRYYWRHKKHGFYNLVLEWYLQGKVDIRFGDKGYFWWGSEGEVLLMERDLVIDLYDRKVDPPRWEGEVPYKYAFFFNQYHLENSRNYKATYFTFSPIHLEEKREQIGRKAWNERKHRTFFAGSIENETQEFFRGRFAGWEDYVEIFACSDRLNKNEPHKFSSDEYHSLVSESLFGISFRGNGPICFRELECLAFGTPLLVTPGVFIDYPTPLKEGVHFLRVNNPEEIPNVLANVSREDWDKMSLECWNWFSSNATPDKIFNQLLTTINSLDLQANQHRTLRILGDPKTASISSAAQSLSVFDPRARWIDKDEDPSVTCLDIDPECLIINQLPFQGRESEYTWFVYPSAKQDYLESIYESQLEVHKLILIQHGLKAPSLKFSLNSLAEKPSLCARQGSFGELRLLDGDLLTIEPDYNWKRNLNQKYIAFSRNIVGPSLVKFPHLKATLEYQKYGIQYISDLSEHFSEYFATFGEFIPESIVYQLCKLWEYEECQLQKIICCIDGICQLEYLAPSYKAK